MSEIKEFFNRRAIDRNLETGKNPILEYEQAVRSRMVIHMFDPMLNEAILDVGCGTGRDLILLGREVSSCIGIDSSDAMIEGARKNLHKVRINGVKVEIGDATNLRFSDQTFDKVLSSEVLEHIPDYDKAISEMGRVLKSSGLLVITTPNRQSMYGFDRYVIYGKLLKKTWSHPYDAWKTFDELVSALNNSGFRVVSFSGICYIPGFVIPYRLPTVLKRLLVFFVGGLEQWLSKILPKNGYMLAIKAVKKKK